MPISPSLSNNKIHKWSNITKYHLDLLFKIIKS